MINQKPEQIARDAIDKQLLASGWIILNLEARLRVVFFLPKILNDCWLFFITKIEQSILHSISNTVNYFTTPLFIFHLLKCVKGKRMFFVDTEKMSGFVMYIAQIENYLIESRLCVADKMEESIVESLKQAEGLR